MVRTDQPIPEARPEIIVEGLTMNCRYCLLPMVLNWRVLHHNTSFDAIMDYWKCNSCNRIFSLDEASAYQSHNHP